MRFGIALPLAGTLSEPAAVSASAAAAEQLGYATVWSSWVGQLAQVAAVTDRVDLGWVWDELLGTGPPVWPESLQSLAERLKLVAAPANALPWLRRYLPGPALLNLSIDAPADGPETGWAPAVHPGSEALTRWRHHHPAGRLVLHWHRRPTVSELGEVHRLRVDEVVVRRPQATSLDQQLAFFAAVAEGLEPA